MVEFLCFCFPFCLPVHFTPIRLFGNVKQQRHLAFFFHIFLKKAWCHFGTYQNCKKRKVELPIRICIDMVEIFLKSPNVWRYVILYIPTKTQWGKTNSKVATCFILEKCFMKYSWTSGVRNSEFKIAKAVGHQAVHRDL